MPQINGFCIFDGWKFDAALQVDKNNDAKLADAQHDAKRVCDGFFIVTGRGLRSRGPALVYPFCVKMHGTVTTYPDPGNPGRAAANKHNQKWELGFIQSILASTRIAKYGPGNEAIKRQNPTNCPVIDRDGSTNYFYKTPTDLKMCGKTEVEMTDEPNHDFEMTRRREMLTEAIEDTTFLTLLAAKHKETGVILSLGGYRWNAHWRATYQNGVFAVQKYNSDFLRQVYGEVQDHTIEDLRIGDDSIACEDNFEEFQNNGWVSTKDWE
jgi:hypothetical protein